MDEIRFYRATGEYGFLSNLYVHGLVFEERHFTCAEEAYQFGKPKELVVAEWLVSAPKPHLCAMAAHALFSWDIRPDWNVMKVDRMRAVLRAKFRDLLLRRMLLDTGNATLIEDSKTDAFWGVGRNGMGKNMLGVLLMDVRQELKAPRSVLSRCGVAIPGAHTTREG